MLVPCFLSCSQKFYKSLQIREGSAGTWAKWEYSSIFPLFSVVSLIFPQIFFIFFLILVFWVLPTREGPGYATGTKPPHAYVKPPAHELPLMLVAKELVYNPKRAGPPPHQKLITSPPWNSLMNWHFVQMSVESCQIEAPLPSPTPYYFKALLMPLLESPALPCTAFLMHGPIV